MFNPMVKKQTITSLKGTSCTGPTKIAAFQTFTLGKTQFSEWEWIKSDQKKHSRKINMLFGIGNLQCIWYMGSISSRYKGWTLLKCSLAHIDSHLCAPLGAHRWIRKSETPSWVPASPPMWTKIPLWSKWAKAPSSKMLEKINHNVQLSVPGPDLLL